MAGLTGLTGLVESLPGANMLPSLPQARLPVGGTVKAITSTVGAQRRSIEAMQAQLRAFDERLTVMEQILERVTEGATVWADLKQTVRGGPSPPDE